MRKRILWLLLLLVSLLVFSGCNSHEHTGGERCEEKAVCEICGEEYGEPAGHLYAYASNRDIHTGRCTREDCTAPEVVGPHGGAGNVCTAPGACAVCGYEYLPQGQHDFRGATCAELGTCIYCGEAGGEFSQVHSFPGDADHCALCGGEYYLSTLQFTINEAQDAYILSGRGTCTRTVITVPAMYRDLPVTQVGIGAFQESPDQNGGRIVEINLPASVTQIGENAFAGCTELETVSMPGVEELGKSAFSNCVSLKDSCIPDSLTKIGHFAFSGCLSLKEVVIPAGVTEIGVSAFYECKNLTKLTLHDGIVSIGAGMVSYCSSLESVYIPAGISDIPLEFAYDCSSLKTVVCGSDIIDIDTDAFHGCKSLESFEFGDALEFIGINAFADCTSLQVVQLPDTVKLVSASSFRGCTALRQLTIPSGVKSVGVTITAGCTSLEYNIYEGMQYLGDENNPYLLFMGRADETRKDVVIHEDTRFVKPNVTFAELQIESMYWGKSVESYWADACMGVATLSKIEVSPENQKYHAQGNCLIETATKTLLHGCQTSVIPNDGSVTNIGSMAFYGIGGLTGLVIPDAVETIGENAIAECTNLAWLVIGSGMKQIENNAVKGASASLVIYYTGTAEDWEKIRIVGYNYHVPSWGDNYELEFATRYYYSETQPTEPGNYWRYVDGVPTPWE